MLRYRACYQVVKCQDALIIDAKAQCRTPTACFVFFTLFLREIAAGARIAWTILDILLWSAGDMCCLGYLGAAAIAGIDQISFPQTLPVVLVACYALALNIRCVRSSAIGTFI